jgi:hypothetical protein
MDGNFMTAKSITKKMKTGTSVIGHVAGRINTETFGQQQQIKLSSTYPARYILHLFAQKMRATEACVSLLTIFT